MGLLGRRRLKLPFFVFYEWTGIWTAIFLFLLVVLNRVDIVPIVVRNKGQFSPITSFTKNIFSSLTSVLFIVEVFKYVKKTAGGADGDQFSLVIILVTLFVMDIFKNIKNTCFFAPSPK